jgi:hypothetical protein
VPSGKRRETVGTPFLSSFSLFSSTGVIEEKDMRSGEIE